MEADEVALVRRDPEGPVPDESRALADRFNRHRPVGLLMEQRTPLEPIPHLTCPRTTCGAPLTLMRHDPNRLPPYDVYYCSGCYVSWTFTGSRWYSGRTRGARWTEYSGLVLESRPSDRLSKFAVVDSRGWEGQLRP